MLMFWFVVLGSFEFALIRVCRVFDERINSIIFGNVIVFFFVFSVFSKLSYFLLFKFFW